MRKRFWTPFRVFLLVLALAVSSALAALLFTPQGSELAVRVAAQHALQPAALSIGGVSGRLIDVLIIRDVYLDSPRFAPKASRISAHDVRLRTNGSPNFRRWQLQVGELQVALPAHARQVSCAYLEGSLVSGLRLYGLSIDDLARLPAGSRVEMRSIDMGAPALAGPKRWPVQIYGIKAQAPGYVDFLWAERAEGNWNEGLVLHEIETAGLRWLPEGSVVRLQRLVLAPGQERFKPVRALNGRLQLPDADPILFSGGLDPQKPDLQLYAKHIDIETAAAGFPKWQAIQIMNGTLGEVHSTLTGNWREPTFTGRGIAERLYRRGVTIYNSTVAFELTLSNIGKGIRLKGTVAIQNGTLKSKTTTVALHPGRIVFSGDPRNPEYDLKGSSVIEGVKINIAIKGTHLLPDLRLSSDPPIPEEWLLLMLASGRRWRGAETSASEGQISPDLARDFIDFFIFGGLGSRIAQRFGISDVSLIFNPDEGRMGVSTTIADKVEVRYETDQPHVQQRSDPSLSNTDPTTVYRVGAGYKITDTSTVKIEGERQLPSTVSPAGQAADTPTDLSPAAKPKDSIFLKFQKKF